MTRVEIVANLKEECHELEVALARYHGARCRETPEELLTQLLKDAEREAQDMAVCALMADVWLKNHARKT
jgi:molybdopterin converting factor small subunit